MAVYFFPNSLGDKHAHIPKTGDMICSNSHFVIPTAGLDDLIKILCRIADPKTLPNYREACVSFMF